MPDTTPPLTGYVFADQPRGPAPPGISVQPLGTFALHHTNTQVHGDIPVRADVGLPLGALVYTVTLFAPFGLDGYLFELVGTPATPTDPPEAPRFVDQLAHTQPHTIVAWRRRVRWAGSPLYLEARWHPTQPATLDLRGVEQDPALHTLAGVSTARALLDATQGARRGRPPATTRYCTREEFYARWDAGAATARTWRGAAHVRDADMARALNISLATLRRYLRLYGRPAR